MSTDRQPPDDAASEPNVKRRPARIVEARQEAERARRRAYREAHAEEIREVKRAWRERNADHVREYRAAYNAAHPGKAAETERNRLARKKAVAARAERRRAYSREYYANNRESFATRSRAARERQRAADPDRYRQQKRARVQRWYDRHKDEQNAKLREKYRDNPDHYREKARAYYYANRERILAQRKATRDANPEAARKRQRQYTARERRRTAAGLPPRRLHGVAPTELRVNQAAADTFFATVIPEERLQVNREPATPPELVARFERDSARVRAAYYYATDAGTHDRVCAVCRRELDLDRERLAAVRAAEMAAEEARLDAIARGINDRLRQTPRRRSRPDLTAPHTLPTAPSTEGLTR